VTCYLVHATQLAIYLWFLAALGSIIEPPSANHASYMHGSRHLADGLVVVVLFLLCVEWKVKRMEIWKDEKVGGGGLWCLGRIEIYFAKPKGPASRALGKG
jgi:hypothetical protein